MPKKKEIIEEPIVESSPVENRKDFLLNLYETLKKENIRSISDLENKIANAE